MGARQQNISVILDQVDEDRPVIEGFLAQVRAVLSKTPDVSSVVHTIKDRVKSRDSLRQKIADRRKAGILIDASNVYDKITDIAGVRLLHIFPGDVSIIHSAIEKVVDSRGWIYREKPKAYSWDPESVEFLRGLGLRCFLKPSYYTSVHYVVRPNKSQRICCEIQVRTLLEEVWGEIDHRVKYKAGSASPEVAAHLGVLARLVGTGARICSALHTADQSGSAKK